MTLRSKSRWLIYDAVCDDEKWKIVVVSASCMSSDWNLSVATASVIPKSSVGDYVKKGGNEFTGPGMNDARNSCQSMMTL